MSYLKNSEKIGADVVTKSPQKSRVTREQKQNSTDIYNQTTWQGIPRKFKYKWIKDKTGKYVAIIPTQYQHLLIIPTQYQPLCNKKQSKVIGYLLGLIKEPQNSPDIYWKSWWTNQETAAELGRNSVKIN